MEGVQLDGWAGPPLPAAARAMAEALDRWWADPDGVHADAAAHTALVDGAMRAVLDLSGLDGWRAWPTSGLTEALNWAVKGAAWKAERHGRRLVVSAGDRLDVRNPARWLARRGWRLTEIDLLPDGTLDLAELATVLDVETTLVSCPWAVAETGIVQPLAELADLVNERAPHARLLVDASAGLGRRAEVSELAGASLVAVGAPWLGAPPGAGALLHAPGVRLEALLHGGPQAGGRRAGRVDLAACIGLGAAAGAWSSRSDAWRRALASATSTLLASLRAALPGLIVHGDDSDRLPGVLPVALPGLAGEPLVIEAERHGLRLGVASGCTSHTGGPSDVLTSMGIDEPTALASIRLVLSPWAMPTDLDGLATPLAMAADALRH